MGWFIFVAVLTSTFIGCVRATDCPNTWVVFHNSCYLFGHGVPMSFYESEAFCRQHGGHLAHVDEAIENIFLKDYIRAFKNESFWIGLTDERIEGIWVWYDTLSSPEFTDWAPGEPNHYHGHDEDCVDYHPNLDFKWNDNPCNTTKQPLCEISKAVDTTGIIG